jgi:hypothetical protein
MSPDQGKEKPILSTTMPNWPRTKPIPWALWLIYRIELSL